MTIGHDEDVLRAIKAQARNASTPISESQVDHVYQIGRRSEQERITRLMLQLAAAKQVVDRARIFKNSDAMFIGLPPSISLAIEEYDKICNETI